MENMNHKNYFIIKDKKDIAEKPIVKIDKFVIKEEPVVEEQIVEEDVKDKPLIFDFDYLKGLNKAEQVDILSDLGISKKNIRKLKSEKARIDAILSLK